jgi:hypothetical protein
VDELIKKLNEMLESEKSCETGHTDSYDDNGNYYAEGIKDGKIELIEELLKLLTK